MFNPAARIEPIPLSNGNYCYAVDEVLKEPERLVAWADERKEAFGTVESGYPGVCLTVPADFDAALSEFYLQHIRVRFDARRLTRQLARYSLVTSRPEQLRPFQMVCHRDIPALDPKDSIQAVVLYLFRDAALGGTGFYEPLRSMSETARLFNDALTMSSEVFVEKYAIKPDYMCKSNEYFGRIGGVEAKWNRLVFYDGSLLHSGDILAPERLSAAPRTGRLTVNGFFSSRRKLE